MSYVDSDGKTHDISRDNALRDGCVGGISLKNYSSERPDTSTAIRRTWNNFKDEFHRNFIKDGRWKYLAKGLGTTLAITALALVLGIVIGVVIAVVRCTYAKTGKLIVLDKICKVYLSIIRGTPVMIQLMIIYFVLLLPVGIEKFPAAVICFGVNSGAYVSEIIRGGIMAVDDGQSEAGRSLGLGYVATMWHIVVPQAFKAILPSLANEFITLLKETSVAFYIGVADLTQGGLKIRSLTYSNFMPLIAVALIYLVLVLALSYLVSLLERRLRKSDRR
ncbi:MAG: amino acid ABC transporter permease [Ruminococcaceae bacterium]|nr:amino acid ABC transporter permease [Oscillospiraceae bacterium]